MFYLKIMVIDVFLQNGGYHNTFKYVSGPNNIQDIFKLLKDLYSS